MYLPSAAASVTATTHTVPVFSHHKLDQSSVTVNQSDQFSYTTVWFEVTIRGVFLNIYTTRQHIHKHQWLQRQTNAKTQKVNFCTLCFPSETENNIRPSPFKLGQLVKICPFIVKSTQQKVNIISIVSFKPPVFQVKFRTHTTSCITNTEATSQTSRSSLWPFFRKCHIHLRSCSLPLYILYIVLYKAINWPKRIEKCMKIWALEKKKHSTPVGFIEKDEINELFRYFLFLIW